MVSSDSRRDRAQRILLAYNELNKKSFYHSNKVFQDFAASEDDPERRKELSNEIYKIFLSFYDNSIAHLKHLKKLHGEPIVEPIYLSISERTKLLAQSLNEFCWSSAFGQRISAKLVESRYGHDD